MTQDASGYGVHGWKFINVNLHHMLKQPNVQRPNCSWTDSLAKEVRLFLAEFIIQLELFM